MTNSEHPISLDSWDIRRGTENDWMPWGSQDNARVKILGEADGYTIALIQAEAGYQTAPHEHSYAEFFYLFEGSIRNQRQVMHAGDGYAASKGSVHTEFEVQAPSTYLSIFRL
jgi:hypothetical protein